MQNADIPEGFFVGRSSFNETRLDRTLSYYEFLQIIRDIRLVKRFEQICMPYFSWNFAAKKFESFVARMQSELFDLRSIETINDVRVVAEIGHEVSSFLSAFRQFVEIYDTLLSRTQPALLTGTFRLHTNTLYDNNFSYRFCWRLRNYASHLALPLHFISVSFHPSSAPGPTTHSIAVDRDKLLAEDIWGSLRPELRSQPPHIQIFPILSELKTHCLSLYGIVFNYRVRRIWQAVLRLNDLLEQVEPGDGVVQTLYLRKKSGGGATSKHFALPEQTVRQLIDLMPTSETQDPR